ncbi:hypothetical protein FQN54_002107 [Arachnomyces sp. PD_36]|nr:hypothetical protein FQN54_002107 [Arachnomyces sp. PD_36]
MNHLKKPEYKGPRFLRDGEYREANRWLKFDYEALCKKVLDCVAGASSIVKSHRIDGINNRVFILETNNRKRLVAKLPYSCTGPAVLTTRSEVSTMKFIKERTRIPVPEVLDWSDDPHNEEVGCEYIIMEYLQGDSLTDKWPTMTAPQKDCFVENFFAVIRQLYDLEFNAYGYIYTHSRDHEAYLNLDGTYYVGPHCGNDFYGLDDPEPRNYDNVDRNCGPWPNFSECCTAIADAGISTIPGPDYPAIHKPWYHGTHRSHTRAMDDARVVLTALGNHLPQDITRPTLNHPDLHMGNIIVASDDPTVIVGIISWRSASIGPAFWQMRRLPGFAEYVDPKEGRGFTYKALYLCYIGRGYPGLYKARTIDPLFFYLFSSCLRAWKDGATLIERVILFLSHRWGTLGFDLGAWPLPAFSENRKHRLQVKEKAYKEVVELRETVAGMLNLGLDDDVRVPLGQFERKKDLNRKLFDGYLWHSQSSQTSTALTGPFQSTQLAVIWPYDMP